MGKCESGYWWGLQPYPGLMQTKNIVNVDSKASYLRVPTFDNGTQAEKYLIYRWERTKATNLGLDFSPSNGL